MGTSPVLPTPPPALGQGGSLGQAPTPGRPRQSTQLMQPLQSAPQLSGTPLSGTPLAPTQRSTDGTGAFQTGVYRPAPTGQYRTAPQSSLPGHGMSSSGAYGQAQTSTFTNLGTGLAPSASYPAAAPAGVPPTSLARPSTGFTPGLAGTPSPNQGFAAAQAPLQSPLQAPLPTMPVQTVSGGVQNGLHNGLGSNVGPTVGKKKGAPAWIPWTLLAMVLVAGAYGAFVGYPYVQELRMKAAALANAESQLADAQAVQKEAETRAAALEEQRSAEGVGREAVLGALSDKLSGLPVKTYPTNTGVAIKMLNEAVFVPNSDEIHLEGRRMLMRLGGALKELSDGRQISSALVSSRTNRRVRGKLFSSTWGLSSARAVAAVGLLVQDASVPIRLVGAAAYSGLTRKGNAGRTLEIVLTPAKS